MLSCWFCTSHAATLKLSSTSLHGIGSFSESRMRDPLMWFAVLRTLRATPVCCHSLLLQPRSAWKHYLVVYGRWRTNICYFQRLLRNIIFQTCRKKPRNRGSERRGRATMKSQTNHIIFICMLMYGFMNKIKCVIDGWDQPGFEWAWLYWWCLL